MIYVHIADGSEETEAVTILDILRRGGLEAGFVSVGGRTVKGAHGIEITADMTFEEADYDRCEMLVMPGGMPGTANMMKHPGLRKKIVEFAEKGKWVCAMCAAPMILGDLGIISGRRATIYPGMEEYLKDAAPTGEPVVRDGKIITSQAPGTAMLFALELVAAVRGEAAREQVKSELYMAI